VQPQKPRDVTIDLGHGDQVEFRPELLDFSRIVTRGQLQANTLRIGEIQRQPAGRFSSHEIVSKNLIIRMLHIL
jgi:hypothetical protein